GGAGVAIVGLPVEATRAVPPLGFRSDRRIVSVHSGGLARRRTSTVELAACFELVLDQHGRHRHSAARPGADVGGVDGARSARDGGDLTRTTTLLDPTRSAA